MTALSGWPRRYAHALLGSWAITLGVAAATALIPGAASYARDAIGATFTPQPASWQQAAGFWLHNTQVAALPLVALFAARYGRLPRTFFDVLLPVWLAFNVAIIGAAIGAYGIARTAPWLPHLPLEIAAIAATLGAYITLRRAPQLPLRLLAASAGTAIALLAAAATLETYAIPHL